jgi:stress-induced morphogen
MIAEDEIKNLIVATIPDADVAVFDTNGMADHFRVWVSSPQFADKNSVQRHQMVYRCLKPAYEDGRLHAVEITTDVPT